jgi:hypothetical protein
LGKSGFSPAEAFENTGVPPLVKETTKDFGQVRDSARVAMLTPLTLSKGEILLGHSPETALVPF